MKNTYRYSAIIIALMLAYTLSFASTATAPANDPQRVVIEVQQKAPPPASQDQKSAVVKDAIDISTALASASKAVITELKDVTFGKDVTVVDGVNNFAQTDVGRFTMFVVGWKVMGRDALEIFKQFRGIVVGWSLLMIVLCLYIWVMRKWFLTRKVAIKKTGSIFSANRVVEYGIANAQKENYRDNEIKGAVVLSSITSDERHGGIFLSSIIYLIVSAVILFAVIL